MISPSQLERDIRNYCRWLADHPTETVWDNGVASYLCPSCGRRCETDMDAENCCMPNEGDAMDMAYEEYRAQQIEGVFNDQCNG